MEHSPIILSLESSCDETACAVVQGNRVHANIVATQIATHARFGGVVPEIASREHLDALTRVVRQALRDAKAEGIDRDRIDAIAVTQGPGLIGALLIGVQCARALASAWKKPLYGIHHMEGHTFSVMLGEGEDATTQILPPHLALLVSGGHTQLVDVQGVGDYRILGESRDDAVGEAFDKAAKMLGLGYPGGPIIDKLAAQGDGSSHAFPRALMAKDSLEFSFSGLKTAMAVYLDKHGQPQTRQALADLCAAYQDAIVDTLLIKVRRALLQSGHRRFHLVGGVAANMRLRGRVSELADVLDHPVAVPALKYCGDNAAMIGAAAASRMRAGIAPSLEVHTNRALDEFPLACNEAQMPSQGSQR